MNGQRRRVIALTTAGMLLAALLAGGGWWLGQRDQGRPAAVGVTSAATTSPRATATNPPATPIQPTPTGPTPVGTWQRLPAAPIPAGPYEFAGVWTGRELLLYGAAQGRGVGAAYNPASNTWRKLPPGPGPAQAMEGGYRAVWTGTEMLGWGLGLDGADDPATNHWRRLPAMGDAGRSEHTAVWTGSQLLVWGGQTYRAGSWTTPPHGLVYDPVANRWSALPKSVLRGRTGHVAVWTGAQMLIWGGSPVTLGGTLNDGAAYTPSPL